MQAGRDGSGPAGKDGEERLAERALHECRVQLSLSNRYLYQAIWQLPVEYEDAGGEDAALATDGVRLSVDPRRFIARFRDSSNDAVRDYMHLLLHCLLRHPFETRRVDPAAWSRACDVCVESMALEMCGDRYPAPYDGKRREALRLIASHVGALTPAKVYRYVAEPALAAPAQVEPAKAALDPNTGLPFSQEPTQAAENERRRVVEAIMDPKGLFSRDSHALWRLQGMEEDAPEGEGAAGPGPDLGGADRARDEGSQAPHDSDGADPEKGAPGEDGDKPEENGAESTRNDRQDGKGKGADDEPARSRGDEGPEGAPQQGSDGTPPNPQASPNASRAQPREDGAPGSQDPAKKQAASPEAPAPPTASAASAAPRHHVPAQMPERASHAASEEERDASEATWQDIAKSVQAGIAAASDRFGMQAGGLSANLELANRPPLDYGEFLRQFAVPTEVTKLDPDSFDYIYYTYGMDHYGNVPLIEPLEYRESKRVRSFVIAIDTSGSCAGDLVRTFLAYTAQILRDSRQFDEEVDVHVVQCDAAVQSDTVITDMAQIGQIELNRVNGLGGTDFRPVFDYVARLQDEGSLADLKGIVYFTDGHGIFPTSPPDCEVAFVFVEEEGARVRVPPWAMRVVMTQDGIRDLGHGAQDPPDAESRINMGRGTERHQR